jgi:hypothetical protein
VSERGRVSRGTNFIKRSAHRLHAKEFRARSTLDGNEVLALQNAVPVRTNKHDLSATHACKLSADSIVETVAHVHYALRQRPDGVTQHNAHVALAAEIAQRLEAVRVLQHVACCTRARRRHVLT